MLLIVLSLKSLWIWNSSPAFILFLWTWHFWSIKASCFTECFTLWIYLVVSSWLYSGETSGYRCVLSVLHQGTLDVLVSLTMWSVIILIKAPVSPESALFRFCSISPKLFLTSKITNYFHLVKSHGPFSDLTLLDLSAVFDRADRILSSLENFLLLASGSHICLAFSSLPTLSQFPPEFSLTLNTLNVECLNP